MTYLGELKYFRLNQFKASELLTFNEKHKLVEDSRKRHKRQRNQLACAYLKEFCDKSSIHGMRFLSDNSLLKFEKIIWAIILLTTSICAVYVNLELNERYQHRIQTIVEDSVYPVFYIPFPSIAICTRYRFNWSKMPAAEAKFLPPNATSATIRIFREFFQRFEDFQFGKFQYFKDLQALELDLINNISIIDVMRFLTYTCDDLFGADGHCMWRKHFHNCCELFTLERTEIGFCQVFNSLISREMRERSMRDKFYPYRNSKSADRSGLQAEIHLNASHRRPGWNGTNGIYLVMKQPDQWHNEWKFIYPNTDTKVTITPQLTETQQDTRAVSPETRNCLFEDETHNKLYKKISGLSYWRGNCRTQCHHEYVMKFCHCRLPLLFPEWGNTNYSICTPKDFLCLNHYEKIFSSERHMFEANYIQDAGESMVCTCMNSCNALVFHNSITSFPALSTREDIQFINLDIYYQSDYMLKYRTILSHTFVELLGNFGGIIGLFLGASLLSAIEMVYYLTIGLAVFIRREKACEPEFLLRRRHFKVRPVAAEKVGEQGKF